MGVDSLFVQNVKTMDSREIAGLTEKDHAHVCRDIQGMLSGLGNDQSTFGSVYKAGNGEDRRCYKLPYRETMILVSGYRIDLRAKIIDRWIELERSPVLHFDIPQTYPAALRLAADLCEKNSEMIAQIAASVPKIESYNAFMRSENTMSITDASKHFGLHPRLQVFPYLHARGYLTCFDLPSQSAIDAGYLALRETRCANDRIVRQAVVKTCQLDTWRTRVVPNILRWTAQQGKE